MAKHLFGATSSPSCANFYLKKMASTYQSEFDPATFQTVKKNMYVDDFMKSVDKTVFTTTKLAGERWLQVNKVV